MNTIDDNYLLEERAAIMEYDGGMPREMAEKMSMKETIIH